MDKTDKLEVFVIVARTRSFSAAARQINLTPSAVSKMINRLEETLGIALFDRSTKTLTLTFEGETYLDCCVRILSDLEETERQIKDLKSVPSGRLRITSSVPIGVRHIQPLVPKFNSCFPDVDIDLSLADDVVDMVDQRIDIAIRVGKLQDSSLIARKLCNSRRVLVASPDYIARKGMPRTPHDLVSHDCLQFNMNGALNEWPFLINGAVQSIASGGKYSANNGETIRHLALSAVGIARLAWFQVGNDIVEGRLVALLEEFHPNDIQGIYAIFFSHRFVSSRVRSYVDFLIENLGDERPFLGAKYQRQALSGAPA
ncbi:LysR family transcriptional regulator [Hoeflea marina]|uniref:LysR family transcriptional regulator n=1 Tax=Hoeflea marina TaxID=274592 RepID=A0A317PJK1_9HYPH|nr:LysR family transcriptional regulator [Hoeflea marina]PWV97767.1 LysR family transcriptional regulator [Hoeflea marina]